MSGTVFFAVGTRRGKAEAWIAQLPDRFPSLEIAPIARENLGSLPDGHDQERCFVVSTPYCSVQEFQEDAEVAMARGYVVSFEYFPPEPLIGLIQRDQRAPSIIGAEALREDLQQLQKPAVYDGALAAVEAGLLDVAIA